MRYFCRRGVVFSCLLCLMGLLCVVTVADAQSRRRSRYSFFSQFRSKSVQRELGLSDEDLKKLRELAGTARLNSQETKKLLEQLNKITDPKTKGEAYRTALEQKSKAAEGAVRKLLTKAQNTRLTQLIWQQRSKDPDIFLSDEVVSLLKITNTQKKRLIELLANRKAAAYKEDLYRRPSAEKLRIFKAKWDPKTIAMLTGSQRTTWKNLLGPPLEPRDASAKKTAAERKTTADNSTVTSAGNSKATPTATPKITATPLPSKRAAEPKEFIASFEPSKKSVRKPAAVKFGSRRQIPASQIPTSQNVGQPRRNVGTVKDAKKAVRGVRMSFNFQNAPWRVVLEFFAKKADLTVDLITSPPDTFSYRDNNLYTPDEALDVLNGYLLPKNFILVRRNQFLVVHNLEKEVPPSIVPDVSAEELPHRGRNELMRVTFELKPGVDIPQVANEISELNSAPYKKVVTIATANRIIVTDIGSHLRQIAKILPLVPPVADLAEISFKSYILKYIPVRDAEKIVSLQLGVTQGVTNVSGTGSSESTRSRGRSRGGFDFRAMMARRFGGRSTSSRSSTTTRSSTATNTKAKVTSDVRTNTLFVMAPGSQLKLVGKMIEALDVPLAEKAHRFRPNRADTEPYLIVYKVLRGADVMEVTKTLNAILPGVVVNEDGNNGKIHVMSTRSGHEYVKELIDKMNSAGGGGNVLETIPLKRLDPVAVANTLTSMYAKEGDGAPTISADITTRQLLVKGSQDQITQIKSFVEKLDGAGPGSSSVDGRDGNTMVFEIPGDQSSFLRKLQHMANGLGGDTEFRIKVPYIPGPVRERTTPTPGGFGTGPRPRNFDRPAGNKPRRTNNRTSLPLRSAVNSSAVNRSSLRSERNGPERSPDSSSQFEILSRDVSEEIFSANNSDDAKNSANAENAENAPVAKGEKRGTTEKSGKTTKQPAPKNVQDRPQTRKQKSQVSIMVLNGKLIITSDDKAALARFRQLVELLIQNTTVKGSWTVFYLRTAAATETANMLKQIFPNSTVAQTASSGGMLGGLSSGLSSLGNSLMDASGLNSLSQTADTLRIIPEIRSNALFVSGSASRVRDVERVLKILDSDRLPESLRDRVPRMIPVKYADVNEIYRNVADLYKDYMESPRSSGSRGGTNMLALLAGGGNRGRGNRGPTKQQSIRLTLSVDERTGQLLVSSSDALFRQIDDYVYQLDKAAYDAKRTTRVIHLENATASVISQTLTSMYPNISVSGGASQRSSNSSQNQRGSSQIGSGSDAAARAERFRRFMQFRQSFGGGGGSRGGSSSRGGIGQSRFGGGRFGSGGRSGSGSRSRRGRR